MKHQRTTNEEFDSAVRPEISRESPLLCSAELCYPFVTTRGSRRDPCEPRSPKRSKNELSRPPRKRESVLVVPSTSAHAPLSQPSHEKKRKKESGQHETVEERQPLSSHRYAPSMMRIRWEARRESVGAPVEPSRPASPDVTVQSGVVSSRSIATENLGEETGKMSRKTLPRGKEAGTESVC